MPVPRKIENVLTVLLVVCAVAVSGAVLHREFFQPQPLQATAPPKRIGDWRRYAVGDMRIGPTSAPVVVTEFSDFQCPFCKRMYQTLKVVQERFPGKVTIVYRNFPLEMLHPLALDAAKAAECAAKDGRFPAFYEFAFQHQDSLAIDATVEMPRRLGLNDSLPFLKCLGSAAVVGELKRDSVDAMKLSIRGTPLLLINEWRIEGVRPDTVIEQYVQRALTEAVSQ